MKFLINYEGFQYCCCDKCRRILNYNQNDIHHDCKYLLDYIICPCGNKICITEGVYK